MGYNLIEEQWIPVRRASGKVERIAPWQIVEPGETAPLRIDSGRADFDAALLEFLIGLIQTVFSPEEHDDWIETYRHPPSPDELRERMLTERNAFFLDGDRERFMQDLTVAEDPKAIRQPIGGLLIDEGMADDASLFAKSGRIEALSFPAAAAALMTLQSFAPSGGRGQCTSLRGGGPLSVTVQDLNLWRTVWANTLLISDLNALPGDRKKKDPAARMPWMGKTRTSDKKGGNTYPQDVHPLQHYWGLPRRFRLDLSSVELGRCSVYGDENVPVVRAFLSRPDGTSYDGPFLHPLTAYSKGKPDEPPNPKKGRSGVAYRDWPSFVTGNESLIPPRVVEVFNLQERWRVIEGRRLAVRGYAMDNMKPLRFLDAETPLLPLTGQQQAILRGEVEKLVSASERVRRTLNQQVKAAWSDRPSDQPGDVEARVDTAFWSATEPAFFRTIEELKDAVDAKSEERTVLAKKQFLQQLAQGARDVFDGLCPLDADLASNELERVARASSDLKRFTHPEGDALLETIGLKAPAPEAKRKPKQKKSGKETSA